MSAPAASSFCPGCRLRLVARTVGIGLVGFGWMGRVHSSAYRRVREHFPECAGQPRLVIAADETESRARAAVDQLGYERCTTDWRDVIADPEVEAISITAPNRLHREIALAASAAGKHFWCEKPVGRSAAETADVAAAAESAGVRTIVGFNYRQAPAVQHAARLISSGALGRVRQYRSQFVADYAANPQGALSWRFLRSEAGQGILGDLMSHAVDTRAVPPRAGRPRRRAPRYHRHRATAARDGGGHPFRRRRGRRARRRSRTRIRSSVSSASHRVSPGRSSRAG